MRGDTDIQVNASGSSYLIAVPEKALVDKVMKSAHQVRTQKDMKLYLDYGEVNGVEWSDD